MYFCMNNFCDVHTFRKITFFISIKFYDPEAWKEMLKKYVFYGIKTLVLVANVINEKTNLSVKIF